MKKRLYISMTMCVLALATGIASIVVAAAGPGENEYIPTYSMTEELETDSDQTGYMLADDNGLIGVYQGGQLLYVTDIAVKGLRAVDRELLERGIETSSYEDVLKMLEDFGS